MTDREFENFFRISYLPLGMYALRMVDDAAVAQDIVQDAFMKTWEILKSGADIDNFKSYMYRSVRNECITFLRRRKETVDIDSLPDVTEESVDNSVMDAKIWKAIEKLPPRCKEIFLMSKRDGLSNEEIAEELGISIKTVKNQMTKAFSNLREELSTGHKPFFLPFL